VTPYDIYRRLNSELAYMAPEEIDAMLGKVCRAIQQVEKIHDAGVMTEAAVEAIEVLSKLRKFEAELRLSR
jgi:hypothetical protein